MKRNLTKQDKIWLLILTAVVTVCILLLPKETSLPQETKVKTTSVYEMDYVIDEETGVNYIVLYKNGENLNTPSQHIVGITPRYNSDNTLYVTEVQK